MGWYAIKPNQTNSNHESKSKTGNTDSLVKKFLGAAVSKEGYVDCLLG